MKKESNQAYEIAQEMTSEEITALFFDKNALVEQPQRVYRLQSDGHRLYYTFDEKGVVTFYVSVTTLIKQTTPTSPHLIKWIAEMGYQEAKEYTQERADYGTFMHSEIARLLIDRILDFDLMGKRLKDYIEVNELPIGFISHLDELKKDVLAFAQFVIDYNVRPLAIEIVLTHKDGYAGAIDMPCLMNIEIKGFFGEAYKSGVNKDKPKESKKTIEVCAIVDFKSGRKGFYEDHEIQLEAYRRMWNEAYPDRKTDKIYNWSPKSWRTNPGYHLKDQTNSPNLQKFDSLVEIAKIEDEKRDKMITKIFGKIDLDNPKIEENIQEITLSELIKKKNERQD